MGSTVLNVGVQIFRIFFWCFLFRWSLYATHSTLVDSTLCMWQGIMDVHTSCHEIVPCHPTKEQSCIFMLVVEKIWTYNLSIHGPRTYHQPRYSKRHNLYILLCLNYWNCSNVQTLYQIMLVLHRMQPWQPTKFIWGFLMYSYVHTNVGWLCEKVRLWTCIPIRYTWNHVQKLFGFQYMSLYIVDGGALSDYAYLYLYWEGFNKLDNHIWPSKVLEILDMTLHCIHYLCPNVKV